LDAHIMFARETRRDRMTKKIDGQITNLAGEFLVAGELARRGLQVSMTFGKWFTNYKTFPSIGLKHLEPYRDNWKVFECAL